MAKFIATAQSHNPPVIDLLFTCSKILFLRFLFYETIWTFQWTFLYLYQIESYRHSLIECIELKWLSTQLSLQIEVLNIMIDQGKIPRGLPCQWHKLYHIISSICGQRPIGIYYKSFISLVKRDMGQNKGLRFTGKLSGGNSFGNYRYLISMKLWEQVPVRKFAT